MLKTNTSKGAPKRKLLQIEAQEAPIVTSNATQQQPDMGNSTDKPTTCAALAHGRDFFVQTSFACSTTSAHLDVAKKKIVLDCSGETGGWLTCSFNVVDVLSQYGFQVTCNAKEAAASLRATAAAQGAIGKQEVSETPSLEAEASGLDKLQELVRRQLVTAVGLVPSVYSRVSAGGESAEYKIVIAKAASPHEFEVSVYSIETSAKTGVYLVHTQSIARALWRRGRGFAGAELNHVLSNLFEDVSDPIYSDELEIKLRKIVPCAPTRTAELAIKLPPDPFTTSCSVPLYAHFLNLVLT